MDLSGAAKPVHRETEHEQLAGQEIAIKFHEEQADGGVDFGKMMGQQA